MSLDRHFLIGVVAQELGIQISKDDPIFACVLLNRWALNTLLDEAMERLKPAFTAHEKVFSEMMKRSLTELEAQEVKMRDAHEKTRKLMRTLMVLAAVLLSSVIAFVFAVLLVSNMSPSLSAKDQRSLQLGRSVESQWTSLDQKSRDIIQGPIKKKS